MRNQDRGCHADSDWPVTSGQMLASHFGDSTGRGRCAARQWRVATARTDHIIERKSAILGFLIVRVEQSSKKSVSFPEARSFAIVYSEFHLLNATGVTGVTGPVQLTVRCTGPAG